MIILITGALGTGKTALAVQLLTESEYYPSSAFVFGVRGWHGAGQYFELPQDPVSNQALFDSVGRVSHSVFLVDEAKKVWPSRVAGRPVPPFIDSHLAESRSVAQDWILTAQAPGQIDNKLRDLVGRHIHIEKTALGLKYCEAGGCREKLDFTGDQCRRWSFPDPSVYALYESSEAETKHQAKRLKLPGRLLFSLGMVAAAVGVVGYFFSNYGFMGFGADDPGKKADTGNGVASAIGLGGSSSGDSVLKPYEAPNQFYYAPKNGNFPELAKLPRYPVSCVASAKRCSCFDQHGQALQVSEFRCRNIVAGKNELAGLAELSEDRPADVPSEGGGPARAAQEGFSGDTQRLEAELIAKGFHPDEVRALLGNARSAPTLGLSSVDAVPVEAQP
jgi:zona occludens toxin